MSISSVRSSLRSRSVVVPLIRCPFCPARVKFYVSNTEKHGGWVFYMCPVSDHFWHWELEYVVYLVDNHFLVGNEAVDALGAAEDKREELMRARNRRYAGGGAVDLPRDGSRYADGGATQMSNQQAEALIALANQILVMMKALVVALIVVAVLLAISMLKK
ncbi:hypothetical protein VPH35_019561 [Triticum aestivum]